MDILTERGAETLRDEVRAKAIFLATHTAYSYIETPKDQPASVDAFLVRDGIIRSVVETKCRYDCDYNKFSAQYESQWLVTMNKIERARAIALGLCVPLVGFLYLRQSDLLLVQSITDHKGMYVPDITIKPTRTQATVNGGSIIRSNAYIDMSGARAYQMFSVEA